MFDSLSIAIFLVIFAAIVEWLEADRIRIDKLYK